MGFEERENVISVPDGGLLLRPQGARKVAGECRRWVYELGASHEKCRVVLAFIGGGTAFNDCRRHGLGPVDRCQPVFLRHLGKVAGLRRLID